MRLCAAQLAALHLLGLDPALGLRGGAGGAQAAAGEARAAPASPLTGVLCARGAQGPRPADNRVRDADHTHLHLRDGKHPHSPYASPASAGGRFLQPLPRVLTFCNGSTVKFGNLPGYGASVEGKYQGQSYDWLFLDEATNFTEEEFRGLATCVRARTPYPSGFTSPAIPGAWATPG